MPKKVLWPYFFFFCISAYKHQSLGRMDGRDARRWNGIRFRTSFEYVATVPQSRAWSGFSHHAIFYKIRFDWVSLSLHLFIEVGHSRYFEAANNFRSRYLNLTKNWWPLTIRRSYNIDHAGEEAGGKLVYIII